GERNIILPMSSSQGMSTQQPGAYGLATLNLIDKRISVELRGFSETQELDFWLIDNKNGQGTLLPEDGDALVKAGSLKIAGGVAKLDSEFSTLEPEGFEPDFMAITSAGKSPVEERLMTAQTTLYHRLYHSEQLGRFGVLSDSDQTEPPVEKGIFGRMIDFLSPTA